MIQCPLKCDPDYVQRYSERDTANSSAYLCTACGKVFYLLRVRPMSEVHEEWREKYGNPEDI